MLVDPGGLIASQVHAGAEQIAALVASLVAPVLEVHHHAPTLGTKAPDPIMRTLEGDEVPLSSELDETSLVLFWNPACGFCEQMLERVRRFDAAPPANAPKLVVVSTGDAAANRAMGLRSPVLIDDAFGVANAFGAPGTPSAVLVDDAGRIASEVAVGAAAVLELAGAADPAAVAA